MSDQTPELNSPPEAAPLGESATNAEPVRKEGRRWVSLVLALGLLLAFGAIAWQWAYSRERIGELRQELAQRLGDGDSTAREARAQANLATEGISELQVRLARIEAQVAESQGQQAALEALYQSLSRNREDQVLAEVEQSIVLAAQQLQLAGNVDAALTALQGAEARLSQLDAGPLVALRKALANDIERLKTSPHADVSGLAVKLDLLVARVDDLGFAFTGEAQASPVERPEPNASNQYLEIAMQFGRELWAELRQLVRVERLDTPDPVLLSPAQGVFLRENLRLRLLSARLSLLSRDSVSYTSDIEQSIKWLQRYFDMRSELVQRTVDELTQLQGVELASDRLPSLVDTLGVLRGLQQRGAPPAVLPSAKSEAVAAPIDGKSAVEPKAPPAAHKGSPAPAADVPPAANKSSPPPAADAPPEKSAVKPAAPESAKPPPAPAATGNAAPTQTTPMPAEQQPAGH